jgi:hypothetical protein
MRWGGSADSEVPKPLLVKVEAGSGFRCVWTVRSVTLLEFFPGTDGLNVCDSIDAQNSVQVIDFMLKQFGKVAIFTRAKLLPISIQVLIADGDFLMPFDLHENREKAQACVPDYDLFAAMLSDVRVDERPGTGTRKLQKNDSLGDAQLRSGNPPAVARFSAPVRQRVAQIRDQACQLNSMGGEIVHGGGLTEARITQLKNFADPHFRLSPAANFTLSESAPHVLPSPVAAENVD